MGCVSQLSLCIMWNVFMIIPWAYLYPSRKHSCDSSTQFSVNFLCTVSDAVDTKAPTVPPPPITNVELNMAFMIPTLAGIADKSETTVEVQCHYSYSCMLMPDVANGTTQRMIVVQDG
jgi:hypothetical protein